MKKMNSFLIILGIIILCFSHTRPVFVEAQVSFDSEIPDTSSLHTSATSTTFNHRDLIQATEALYKEDIFSGDLVQIAHSTLHQPYETKGVNKSLYLGNGVYDNYIDSTTWSLAVSLGLGTFGLLLGVIPGINVTLAGFIVTVAGRVGAQYLHSDTGVIIRTKQVTIPATQISGMKMENHLVSIREQ